jgi:4-hydroxybenzoate polyprenyltransferase
VSTLNPPEAAADRPGRAWPPVSKRLTELGCTLDVIQQFIRLPAFGFTAMLVLLGAASVAPHLAARQALALLGVALAFHCYSYVLNDVIDLPLDRTQPLRARDPLVRGVIRPGPALAFALCQLPIALVITARLGGDAGAYAALGAGFALMGIYNLWGKRTPLPPATDVIQGMAWGALALYGAAMQRGSPSGLTIDLCAFAVVYITLLNGVHASLRDLTNDLARGMRSTAILLGARPQATGRLAIPGRLKVYGWALQALSIGLLLAPLWQNALGYGPIAWGVTCVAVLLLSARGLRLVAIILSPATSHAGLARALGAYLFTSLSSLVALFALRLAPGVLAALLAACLLPLLPKTFRQVIAAWRDRPATPATKAKPG